MIGHAVSKKGGFNGILGILLDPPLMVSTNAMIEMLTITVLQLMLREPVERSF